MGQHALLNLTVGRQVMGVNLLASDEKKVKSRKRADREATVVFPSQHEDVYLSTHFLSVPVSR